MKTKIVYEDKDILVCHKPAGLATQSAQTWQQDLVSECKNYLAAGGNKNPFLGIVHRLDQPVEGLLVLAKNQKAAAALSSQLQAKSSQVSVKGKKTAPAGSETEEIPLNKTYYALVLGSPTDENGELTDHLVKEGNAGKVVDPGTPKAKKAHLGYRVLQKGKVGEEEISLLEIRITTGRFHQIRLQLSHADWPILGDLKYGGEKAKTIGRELHLTTAALCACALDLTHPVTGEKLHYEIQPSWYHAISGEETAPSHDFH